MFEQWIRWVRGAATRVVFAGCLLAPATLAAGTADFVAAPLAGSARSRASVTPASGNPVCLGCGVEMVDWETFDGRTFRLERHRGRHVAFLLAEERPRNALTEEELRLLIDLTDLLYESYADLLGGVPKENVYSGLLPIAFVPTGIGAQGLLGNKGIEINPGMERELRKTLFHESVPWILMHEMGHNFDLYSPFTEYLPGHAHAWTWFTDLYMPYFTRAGENLPGAEVDPAGFVRPPRSPREFLRLSLEGNWRSYIEDPAADWDSCVKVDGCFWGALQYWAGFHLHLASQFGVDTTRDFFRALSRRVGPGHPVPNTPEAREEVWLEAWAEATRSDVSCYAEVLRWRSSDGLRERIQANYGTRAPLCVDRDQDGYRPIEGDCDDRDEAVHPGRKDPVNGIDDDCDGLIDEKSVRDRKKKPVQKIRFPAQVAARIEQGVDKEFVFDPDAGGVVWTEICYEDEGRGWYFFLNGARRGVAAGTNGACLFGKVETTGEPIRLRHETHSDGRFTLTVAEGDRWPVPWATVARPVVKKKKARFRVETDLSVMDERPTHVRFWVSGTGWVDRKRFRPSTRGTWKLPVGTPAGEYGVRAQLLRKGVPISKVSPMTVFEIR